MNWIINSFMNMSLFFSSSEKSWLLFYNCSVTFCGPGLFFLAAYSVVPSLSPSYCLSSQLCCTFTICGLLLEHPTLLFLHFLWVVIWAPYSVVPSLSPSYCLSSQLCCTFTIYGFLLELPTLLYLHFLWVAIWAPSSVVPSLSVGWCV